MLVLNHIRLDYTCSFTAAVLSTTINAGAVTKLGSSVRDIMRAPEEKDHWNPCEILKSARKMRTAQGAVLCVEIMVRTVLFECFGHCKVPPPKKKKK